jgi:DNA-binding NtrC family response regulator
MPLAQLRPALLVVDDTPSIQQLLIHLLHDVAPYDVVAVSDAAAALKVLGARQVPLVIADYHLPDMRGDALGGMVKAQSPDTKVLLITADITLDGVEAWPDVDACLIKPFQMRDLVAMVRDLLAPAVR